MKIYGALILVVAFCSALWLSLSSNSIEVAIPHQSVSSGEASKPALGEMLPLVSMQSDSVKLTSLDALELVSTKLGDYSAEDLMALLPVLGADEETFNLSDRIDLSILVELLLLENPELFLRQLTEANRFKLSAATILCHWAGLDYDAAALYYLEHSDGQGSKAAQQCFLYSRKIVTTQYRDRLLAGLSAFEVSRIDNSFTKAIDTDASFIGELALALTGTQEVQAKNLEALAVAYGKEQLYEVLEHVGSIDNEVLRIALINKVMETAAQSDHYPLVEIVRLAQRYESEVQRVLSNVLSVGQTRLYDEETRGKVLALLSAEDRLSLHGNMLDRLTYYGKNSQPGMIYAASVPEADRVAVLGKLGRLLAFGNPSALVEFLEDLPASNKEAMQDSVFSLILLHPEIARQILENSNNELLKIITAERYVEHADDWQTRRDRVLEISDVNGHEQRMVALITAGRRTPFEAAELLDRDTEITYPIKLVQQISASMVREDPLRALEWFSNQSGAIKENGHILFVGKVGWQYPIRAKGFLAEIHDKEAREYALAGLAASYGRGTPEQRRQFKQELGPIIANWLCSGC